MTQTREWLDRAFPGPGLVPWPEAKRVTGLGKGLDAAATRGEIAVFRISNRRFVSKDDLADFLERHRMPAEPESGVING